MNFAGLVFRLVLIAGVALQFALWGMPSGTAPTNPTVDNMFDPLFETFAGIGMYFLRAFIPAAIASLTIKNFF